MKHAKKLASLLLALVMVLSLAVTAFAAGETGTITIDNAVKDQTYTIYKILDLESYDLAAGTYSYKVTAAWKNFFNGTDINGVYVDVDTNGYVTWKMKDDKGTETGAAEFAKLAQKYAADNKLTNQGSKQPTITGEGVTTGTVKFENLDLGYYLVDSTLGALCSLDTTNPNAIIEEKNEQPTVEKQVKEDDKWGNENDAKIGDTVEFQTIIHAKPGAASYVLHDKMTAGLTLNATSIVVKAGNTTLIEDTNYTLSTSDLEDDCTFEITFDKTYLDSITEKTDIIVTYTATLNENAVVGSDSNNPQNDGNQNTTKLDYGDKTTPDTTPDETTKTKTWEFGVSKFYMEEVELQSTGRETKQVPVPLAYAKFTLSTDEEGKKLISLVSLGEVNLGDENDPEMVDYYRVAKEGETGTITEITTSDNGVFYIKGLDSGTYYLTETAAPTGYNKLDGAIEVVIDSNGSVKYKMSGDNDYTSIGSEYEPIVPVENKSGTELPSTGGMGTTIFYVLGGILVVGAAILLVTKKRMSVEK